MSLPDWIDQVTNLYKLYLDNNQLTSLLEGIKQLVHLKNLYLHGNDRLNLPRKILGSTWQEANEEQTTPAKPSDILNYYFHTR